MESRIPASERTSQKLTELLTTGVADGDARAELLKLAVRKIVEGALDAEVRDALGRGYYESGAEPGRGYRNGYRRGRLRTAEGAIEYGIPQVADRAEPFVSRVRGGAGRTAELEQLAVEMSARGLSVRDIEAAFRDATGASVLQVNHQPQDRQGARPHDPAVAADASGSGDRVNRRAVLAGSIAFLAAPFAAQAQQARKVWRIGFLRGSAPPKREIDAFRDALRELGYVEHTNLVIEYRWADGHDDRLPALAAELLLRNVDLFVASAPAATQAARETTKTIPIVMVTVADPVAFGFVRSLAHPGANVTGLAFQHPELSGKRLALLKEAIPKLSRVAVLWNGANPYKPADMKEVEAAATTASVVLHSLAVNGPHELETAISAAKQSRSDALITLEDPFTVAHRVRIVELIRAHRLPALYGRKVYVDAGGLMSYGPDPIEQYRRAAIYVDKIFKGARPADLPIEQPTKFEFVINLKTAKALGLTIPPSLLLRADQVIE